MRVVILLAVYNGERFLPEQLASIAAQTHRDWLLLASDDGSDDSSAALLDDFVRRYPSQAQRIPGGCRRGPLAAFAALLDHALAHESHYRGDGEYAIAFADQDDRWHPDRLRLGVACIATEQLAAKPLPLLVYSELRLIDSDGRTLAERFSRYQGFDPQATRFSDLIIGNVVSGCSALLTPSLARLCAPLPAAAVMHDWWVALIASLYGRLCFIDQPLVDYRQHSDNAIGAQHRPVTLSAKLARLKSSTYHDTLLGAARQAAYLRSHSPRPLTRVENLACLLTQLMAYNNAPLRLVTLRLLRHLRLPVGRTAATR